MSQGKSVIHGRGFKQVGRRPPPRGWDNTLGKLRVAVARGYRHFCAARGLPEFESDRFRFGGGKFEA